MILAWLCHIKTSTIFLLRPINLDSAPPPPRPHWILCGDPDLSTRTSVRASSCLAQQRCHVAIYPLRSSRGRGLCWVTLRDASISPVNTSGPTLKANYPAFQGRGWHSNSFDYRQWIQDNCCLPLGSEVKLADCVALTERCWSENNTL